MAFISGVFPLHIGVNPNTIGVNLNIPDVSPSREHTLYIRAGNPSFGTLPLNLLSAANTGVAGFADLNTAGFNTPSGTLTLYVSAPLSSGVANNITLFAKAIPATGYGVHSIPLYLQQNMFSGVNLYTKGGWDRAIGVAITDRSFYKPVEGTRILHIERIPAHNSTIDLHISGTGSAGSMDLALINNEKYLALNMSDISPRQTTNLYVSGGWNGQPNVPNMSGSLNMYIDI